MSLLEMQNNIIMLLTAKIDERANGLEVMVRENTMKIEAIKKSVDFIFGEVKTLKSDMKKVEVICQENEKKVAELEQKVNEAERYQRRCNHGTMEFQSRRVRANAELLTFVELSFPNQKPNFRKMWTSFIVWEDSRIKTRDRGQPSSGSPTDLHRIFSGGERRIVSSSSCKN